MYVKSNSNGALTDYLGTVNSIRKIITKEDEIIEFNSTAKNICISTKNGTFAASLNALNNAKEKFYVCSNREVMRHRITLKLPNRKDTTNIYLYQLIAVADYLQKNKMAIYDVPEDYEVNHIDFSGNLFTRGFVNENSYNIEFTPEAANKVHKIVENKLYKLYNKYFGISANDWVLMNVVTYGTDEDIRKYFMEIKDTFEFDKYGTLFVGKAGLKLKQFKEEHDKINGIKTEVIV